MFGHDAILPIEVNLQTIRIAKQCELHGEDYWNVMFDELNELEQERINASENIVRQKESMSRYYNHRMKNKRFLLGNLVWKTILSFEKMPKTYGKWSQTWEGPYQITKIFSSNVYCLANVASEEIRSINGKYLKIYKPSMHEVKIPT